MGRRLANKEMLAALGKPPFLIPLVLVLSLSCAAGFRAFAAAQAERIANDRREEQLATVETLTPPTEFAAWSNVGPSDVFLSAQLSLEPENITMLHGMSYLPTSVYGDGGGGVLLINPPEETKFGDAAGAQPDEGGVLYEGSDPWCRDAEGHVLTVGELGAEFTFPGAGYLTGGEEVTLHVKLSNVAIRVNQGASLASSADAAASGTGFSLGENGVVKGHDSSRIRNTAANGANAYDEHTLAEGQYVVAYGNMTFLSAFGTVPQAFARPLLLNQCYWGAAQDASNVSLGVGATSDDSSAWRVWDCGVALTEHGRFAEGHGRNDDQLHTASSEAAGTTGKESNFSSRTSYERVVSLQFDVDAYFTYEDYDGNEVLVDGVVALGMTGIDEPDRSRGIAEGSEYEAPFVEAVTWRYGLTNSPIYVRNATWKTFHGEAEPGGAPFEYETVSEGKNKMVNLEGLVTSHGVRFTASHEAGDAMSIDFDDDGTSLGEYLKQEATAGHMTLVKAGGFGFTWCGSGAQCKVMTQGNISKYLSVAARGENADKVTVEDVELSSAEGVMYQPLMDAYLPARSEGTTSNLVYTYRPPWKSDKTLVARAEEGYHISRVIISDIYDDLAVDDDEDVRHGEIEVPDEERAGVRGDVHEVVFETGKVLPEGTTLSGYWDGVTVKVAEDGSVIICPTIRYDRNPFTGEVYAGFTKDVYVRVEAVSDEYLDVDLSGPDESDQAFIL